MTQDSSPSPRALVQAGIAGCALAGLLLGRLTLKLNPHLLADASDRFGVVFYFLCGYGLVGLFLGLIGAGLLILLSRFKAASRLTYAAGAAASSVLLLGPALYYLLLPDVGLYPRLLSGMLFGASPLRTAATLAGIGVCLIATGMLLRALLLPLAHMARVSSRSLITFAWAIGMAAAATAALGLRPPPEASAGAPAPVSISMPKGPWPRLVLLCIDGCDLDDMVLPMVRRGELPTFARLMREGAWGPLQTIEPTLSSVVWTTLITGKRPDQHGIRHFIVFRLPGIERAIYQFPRHTGLNFRLFPILERIPGMPVLQTPYTSNMRQAEALWGIAGRFCPVGAYRWLVTWPVETVNGFNVAGGVGWLQIMSAFEEQAGVALEKGFHHPKDVFGGLEPAPRIADVTREMLEPYVGRGYQVPMSDFKLKAIAAGLRDPTGHYLPKLIDKYDARFTAAAFYSVDEFCHYFAVHKDKGGAFSNAVAERYRFTDTRLGEFLDSMGDSVNMIVVSDHGYNFEQNHHTDAPDGVFFARGPAFAGGRRVDGLTVYDVAPLCLHLLSLPLPEDMPATKAGRFLKPLSTSLAALTPDTIPTYETGRPRDSVPVESPIDDLIKEQLRNLGYIN